MTQHGSTGKGMSVAKALLAALAALVAAAVIALAPQADAAQGAPDRRAVSNAKEDNGLPAWYRDARGTRVFQCDDAQRCGIEDEGGAGPAEVVYWAGEASIPVGRKGVDLVMAVEGSFMNPDGSDAEGPNDQTIAVTESVLQVNGVGLRPNRVYKITHPYGIMRVRTDNRGRFRNAIERGCDLEGAGETCNHRLALRSPLFKGFLRWDPRAGARSPSGFMGDPERAHRVVGSPNGTNYFKVEQLRPGKRPVVIGRTVRFSITGQKTRGTQSEEPAPPEEQEPEPTDPPIDPPIGL